MHHLYPIDSCKKWYSVPLEAVGEGGRRQRYKIRRRSFERNKLGATFSFYDPPMTCSHKIAHTMQVTVVSSEIVRE